MATLKKMILSNIPCQGRGKMGVGLMIQFILSLILLYLLPLLGTAQVTPVMDREHIETSRVESYSAAVSTSVKAILENGFIEKISKVQEFFKLASEIVSAVVKNLKMTKELIETEQDIFKLYIKYLKRLDESEDFEDKWKYRWILGQLFLESNRIFEVFDIATQENMGIIDDKGRIQLIKQTLIKAKSIKRSLRATMRRANRQVYRVKRQQKELEVFTNLFE